MLDCLTRRRYDAAALIANHPPAELYPHKQLVFDLCCPPGAAHSGTLELTRWREAALPDTCQLADTEIEAVPGTFDYRGDERGVWHLNFADPHLFCGYASSLLAQDELQAAEHPLLGCVLEALLAEGLPALTEERRRPTPVLVTGVERRCELQTAPTSARPGGLYGNRFAAASASEVLEATRVLTPPTRTNLIAIAAPSGGFGTYDSEDVERVMVTAFTGFSAAVAESRRLWRRSPVEIRTGFWGCGAFGGSRHAMTLMQLLAARMAGVDRVRFYVFDEDGLSAFQTGAAHLAELLAQAGASSSAQGAGPVAVAPLLAQIEARGYRWGMSDGN